MNKKALMTMLTLALIAGIWLVPTSCAREPKYYLPKVGQKYEFLPVAMDSTESIKYVREDLGGLHLTIRWGGRPIDKEKGNPRINFYQKGQDVPVYSALWADMETAFKTSGCTNEQIETLDGPMHGVTLICDGRIKISEIERIEAVDDAGDVKTSNDFSTYKRADDVLSVIIQLY